jgi:hypothetical protein
MTVELEFFSSVEKIIEERALELARQIVMRTSHTMKLEGK